MRGAKNKDQHWDGRDLAEGSRPAWGKKQLTDRPDGAHYAALGFLPSLLPPLIYLFE